jgi:oxygen-independent coproporphyrinogen-3 oxidase
MAGIYLHIPFCKQACYYCDFHFSTNQEFRGNIVQAMVQEIEMQKRYLEGEKIDTIYFGGGTPSLLDTEELMRGQR